ncbi:hypothetical protein QVD17_06738 [Tagetes erecta]|uniref:Uncharacterized protein n=1 Tax=Tagetes erecta TaxID=13708 RepID=A0AAD8LP07_TARER|nr:hypothetical protein QVD17_06738 [Tagetes erecta]
MLEVLNNKTKIYILQFSFTYRSFTNPHCPSRHFTDRFPQSQLTTKISPIDRSISTVITHNHDLQNLSPEILHTVDIYDLQISPIDLSP